MVALLAHSFLSAEVMVALLALQVLSLAEANLAVVALESQDFSAEAVLAFSAFSPQAKLVGAAINAIRAKAAMLSVSSFFIPGSSSFCGCGLRVLNFIVIYFESIFIIIGSSERRTDYVDQFCRLSGRC